MSALGRRSLAGIVGLAVGVAGLAFVGIRIARDWDQIVETMRSANPAWLLAAVVAGLVSMTLIAVNWLSLIERRGHVTTLTSGLSWFFVGQLGKYVPGGIWPVVGQAELASRAGPDRRSTYLATASSMTTTLLGAVTVAVVSGLASPYDRWVTAALIGLGLAVGFGALGLPQARTGLGRLASAILRRPVELPDARIVAVYTLRHVPVWVMYGAMNICVFVALGGSVDTGLAVDLLFASTLSWIVGFVVIGVPGGLGVRETVFVGLMTGPIGATLALSVAVTSRLVTVVVDLTGAIAAATLSRCSRSTAPTSVRSPFDVTTDEAGDPDSLLQRGSDIAADGR
ncbi:MAG: YbhN family protein [Ilumatobacteraceae bacterium]